MEKAIGGVKHEGKSNKIRDDDMKVYLLKIGYYVDYENSIDTLIEDEKSFVKYSNEVVKKIINKKIVSLKSNK
ncbi:MAG: hypothetical protein JXR48_14610 [Candidatus Delongbacteria bacterium]|nr:hypothetical protein [Candidatus Delongbacteria bacterium]MBN2836188.1 hypothetical protein [Candidatus Delongbacteria bacterium]